MDACFYNKNGDQFFMHTSEFETLVMDETYLNEYVSASRILAGFLGYEIPQQDWSSIAYVRSPFFTKILRHVTLTSFISNDTMYVPVPDLPSEFNLDCPPQLAEILQERLDKSMPITHSEDFCFESFVGHEDPDYISILLEDYTFYSGINEVLYLSLIHI